MKNTITFAAAISVNYNIGMLYYISGNDRTINIITFTNLPITSLTSYTFTFILNTISSSNYITASSAIVNGSTVRIRGRISVRTPDAYLIQQITIFNTSTTTTPTFAAVTSVTSY